jgi:hypothetical protein
MHHAPDAAWTFLLSRRDQESIDLAASPLSAPLPANHSHKSPAHTYTLSMYIHDVCMRGERAAEVYSHFPTPTSQHITYYTSNRARPGFGIKHQRAALRGNIMCIVYTCPKLTAFAVAVRILKSN